MFRPEDGPSIIKRKMDIYAKIYKENKLTLFLN